MQIISNPDLIDQKKWSEFVQNHPNGSVFQLPEMYEVYANTKNYTPIILAGINENKEIEAILLAVIQTENYPIVGKFTARSIIFGGPLILGENLQILDKLLEIYVAHISNKAIYSQFRNFTYQNNNQKEVYKNHGFIFIDHLNIIINLTSDPIELWKGVKRKRKDGINKARKQGFVFSSKNELENIEVFYQLLVDLYKKIGLPYPNIIFFKNLNNQMKSKLKWFILEHKGKPAIILCAFVNKKTLYAFYIGICQDSNFLKLRPVDLFYWEVIQWASKNGIKYFDWMGAGKPDEEYGVRKFKLQYGGDILNLGRYEKIHNNFFFNIGKMGLKIIKKFK